MEPEVAVSVSVYTPLGVPVIVVEEPPPPHPIAVPNRAAIPRSTSSSFLQDLARSPSGNTTAPKTSEPTSKAVLSKRAAAFKRCGALTKALLRGVVATATDKAPEPPAVKLRELGDTVQADEGGAPVQLKFTIPEKPAA